jgi:hypothetical protein
MNAVLEMTSPLSHVLPVGGRARLLALQRPWFPLLTPKSPTVEDAASLVDSGPLYAGETVLRIHDVPPAGELVRGLVP